MTGGFGPTTGPPRRQPRRVHPLGARIAVYAATPGAIEAAIETGRVVGERRRVSATDTGRLPMFTGMYTRIGYTEGEQAGRDSPTNAAR